MSRRKLSVKGVPRENREPTVSRRKLSVKGVPGENREPTVSRRKVVSCQ